MAHKIAEGATVKKGERRANSGRKKGQTNRQTKQAKALVMEALDKLGGVDYLVQLANEYPKEFLASMLSKLIPKAVDKHVTGDHQLVIISEFDMLDDVDALPPPEGVTLISPEDKAILLSEDTSIENDPDFQ